MNELEQCIHYIKHYKNMLAGYNDESMQVTYYYKSELKYWQVRKLKTVLNRI